MSVYVFWRASNYIMRQRSLTERTNDSYSLNRMIITGLLCVCVCVSVPHDLILTEV